MPTLKIQKADGTFEFLQLAGEEFADIGNQVLDVKSQLAQTVDDVDTIFEGDAITPEMFAGNDFQKVQQAIDKSIEIKKPLKLSKTYTIGSETFIINKGSDIRGIPLYIYGGGKIKKTQAGYMFKGGVISTSDVFFLNISFEGVEGINVDVFDCGDGDLIRVNTQGCTFHKIRNVFYSATYLQDIKMNNDIVTECSGSVFDLQGGFGIYVTKLTHEFSTGRVVKQLGNTPPFNSLINVVFRDCIIEGFSPNDPKTLFELSRGSITINDCYFEAVYNGIVSFTGTAEIVDIQNNTWLGQTNGKPFVKWGHTVRKGLTSGNICPTGIMSDASSLTSGRIKTGNNASSGADIDPNQRIFDSEIDIINNRVRRIGTNHYRVISSKVVPDTNKVDICTITPFINGGGYISVKGGGLQGNVGVFGLNKTFKYSRFGSTLIVTTDVNDSWGDSVNQKDNVFLEVSGTNLVLRVNGRTGLASCSYDLSVEIDGRVELVTAQ